MKCCDTAVWLHCCFFYYCSVVKWFTTGSSLTKENRHSTIVCVKRMLCWPLWCDAAVCRMPHRAPGSSPPLVGLAAGQVVPVAGVWWGRERSGLTGAGRALRHSTVLLCGRTIVWVTLTSIHFLVTEVDAQYLPCRLPLATGYWALKTHTVNEEISREHKCIFSYASRCKQT